MKFQRGDAVVHIDNAVTGVVLGTVFDWDGSEMVIWRYSRDTWYCCSSHKLELFTHTIPLDFPNPRNTKPTPDLGDWRGPYPRKGDGI